MKRFARLLAAAAILAGVSAPALAVAALNTGITTAVTAQTGVVLQFRSTSSSGIPANIGIQGTFNYGSGGTTATAWLQTSFDGGTTWVDMANFSFTTASARFVYNLTSRSAITTEYVPTDGTLAANTSHDGLIGNLLRVKYTTTGTYVGTTLRVDVISAGGPTAQ